MLVFARPPFTLQTESPQAKWARRRDIPIAILAWTVLACLAFWGAGYIIQTILRLTIAALLAYTLAPGVKLLQRFMPRLLAILVMYLLVLGCLCVLLYFVVTIAIDQVSLLATNIQKLLTPVHAGQPSPVEHLLRSFGLTSEQVVSLRVQLTNGLEEIATSALPLVTGLVNVVADIVLVTILSIYLLIDGSRVATWLRKNAPHPARVNFMLDTVQRVVGGYIRGQLLMATLIGLLVGSGMVLFHVPYAVLLGVLAFILEFIPVLGTLMSGVVCVLIALTQGWLVAIGVLGYFIGVHILEGNIVGPRIVGNAVGLHPLISIIALAMGSELFGIWGALFASPVAGVLQALIVALWDNWRETHPEHFTPAKQQEEEGEATCPEPLDADKVAHVTVGSGKGISV